MKVMLDLNVVLDVVQHREPHYDASARAMSSILEHGSVGCLASHSLTTLHDIVARNGGRQAAGFDVILTRNVADFGGSPVRAVTPEEFLAEG
jgi:hypothetical protein